MPVACLPLAPFPFPGVRWLDCYCFLLLLLLLTAFHRLAPLVTVWFQFACIFFSSLRVIILFFPFVVQHPKSTV
ncbi:hypothetical protein QBC45DRAFT_416737, partial [Copromyces sp. CBS 386.78]